MSRTLLLSLGLFGALALVGGCRSAAVPVDVGRIEVERAGAPAAAPRAAAPVAAGDAFQAEAQAFLDAYHARYVPLYAASQEAEWATNTRIVEGDTVNAHRLQLAQGALGEFRGSAENIAAARRFLARREALAPLQAKQFEVILYEAALYPQTVPALVERRIAAQAAQTERLYGYTFRMNGAEVTPNEIDRILRESTDLSERRAAWEASKAVGPTLTEGLLELRDLRNGVVEALGYDDFFAYQASNYGTDSDALIAQMDRLVEELRPLYRELHTWTRHELAARYGRPVPALLPADWLPNRWGQDWSAMVEVEGVDLDGALASREPEWLVEQAERFYVSLGFEELPESFYTQSSLYPVAEDAGYKKNTHASAWHMDLNRDVRSLMSVEPDADWYETTHHELGHIYYYLEYANPNVPPVLREGANRAYHEAVGSLMGLAAMQPRFLQEIGLLDPTAQAPDSVRALLREALNYAVFIPWSAGTMTHWEHDLYAEDLAPDEWNARWWEYVARYQGIAPPDAARAAVGAPYNDAATKTHVSDDPAQYYDYALSFVLLFQLHDHIATEILGESPRNTNYYGRREVGDFLRGLLRRGATADGDALLREATGSELSARPMLDYFAPLMDWLREENRGRAHTL
jgi:peptidyl-dipeptidase A